MNIIMKKSNFFGFLILTMFLNSCSDTKVVYSPIDIKESIDEPAVSGFFTKQVLIEDYTGTWCGNCAKVSYAIEKVKEETDRSVSVAIHNGIDPYNFVGIQPLQELISPNSELALPQVRLNRTIVWTTPDTNTQQAVNLTSNNCGLGLAMNSVVTDETLNLTVNVKFAQNYTNLKLVVYVLENHLIYRQANYSTYFNSVNPILDFEHNHVLRTSLTNLLGNTLTNTNYNETETVSFSVPVPANISNKNNMSFVAFVIDQNNKVINVRAAEKNETQIFQQNP